MGMELVLLIGFAGLAIYIIHLTRTGVHKDIKIRKLEKKVKESESKIPILELPEYLKHYDNSYPLIYKLRDIRIVPQNATYHFELCAVVTVVSKSGGTLNATIDKFIAATEKEYNEEKREELKF